jgi:hypothetical protein
MEIVESTFEAEVIHNGDEKRSKGHETMLNFQRCQDKISQAKQNF